MPLTNSRTTATILVVLACALFFAGLAYAASQPGRAKPLMLGYSGSNLEAALYAASAEDGFPENVSLERLGDPTTIAYALISGDLDAGFIDAEKLLSLSELPGFEELGIVGKVTYPYGATLVVRKDGIRRINELDGATIAISSPDCKLLKAFQEDAERLGADLSNTTYVVTEFSSMLPALESGQVDAVIVKGNLAVTALQSGHHILYQNWDVEPGDLCCPPILDQTALILLSRKDRMEEGTRLSALLEEASSLGDTLLRKATFGATQIPIALLEEQPVASFSKEDDSLLVELREHDHDDDDDEDDEAEDNAEDR